MKTSTLPGEKSQVPLITTIPTICFSLLLLAALLTPNSLARGSHYPRLQSLSSHLYQNHWNCGYWPLLLCLGKKNRASSLPRDGKSPLPATEHCHPTHLLPTGATNSPANQGGSPPLPGTRRCHPSSSQFYPHEERSRFFADRRARTAPHSPSLPGPAVPRGSAAPGGRCSPAPPATRAASSPCAAAAASSSAGCISSSTARSCARGP